MMAKILVVHNTFAFAGGADIVALHTIAALAEAHDVSVVTMSPVDLAARTAAVGLDIGVAGVTVHTPRWGGLVTRGLTAVSGVLGGQSALQSALIARARGELYRRADLVVSTTNELGLRCPNVQYIHAPQFPTPGVTGLRRSALTPLYRRLARADATRLGHATLLANSAWTADRVAEVYGHRPAVLAPPVTPVRCEDPPAERTPGVVLVGRIAPDKRVLAAIEAFDAVVDTRGPTPLHIIGTAAPMYRGYREAVLAASASRPHVTVHLDADRSMLRALLCRHTVGLGMKPHEHFGMAIAEYATAGVHPVTPASGGQVEIVERVGGSTFRQEAELAETLTAALEAPPPRPLPPDIYAPARFRAGMRAAVTEALADAVK
jgi:glycosyltransferase involved in cell wall biosynthesis